MATSLSSNLKYDIKTGIFTGYCVVFGDEHNTDLDGSWVDADTNFGDLSLATGIPIVSMISNSIKVVGEVDSLKPDSYGVYCIGHEKETVPSTIKEYLATVCDKEVVHLTTACAAHCSEVGGYQKNWFIVQVVVTPTPLEPAPFNQ